MNADGKKLLKEYFEYSDNAVCCYMAVSEAAKMLNAAGFKELRFADGGKKWKLEAGGKYYTVPFASTLFAFTVAEGKKGNKESAETDRGLRIEVAHTDHPCLHVKPVAEMAGPYKRVDVEVYGGPILNTWLDRPLSLAGRVMLKSDRTFDPVEKFIDVKRPVLTIPNLAIHYNRDVNKGVELKKQVDLIPIMGGQSAKGNEASYFTEFIAKELKCKKEDILDFDLFVYNTDKACLVGADGEYVLSPRIDNLSSCFAAIKGIIDAPAGNGINVAALFDNEEVGSRTKQGADSSLLTFALRKIYRSLGKEEMLADDIHNGFLLSMDVAHATHPAHPEKMDTPNGMYMNDGVTIKLSANQRYTYDSVAVAGLMQLCGKYGIKYKRFVNHSDAGGGSTMGPMVSSLLPMKTVDIGVPMLAMHSACELMGAQDLAEITKLAEKFFDE